MPELIVSRPERPEALAEWRVAALALIPGQVLRRGNFDVANRLLHDDYVMHDLPSGRDVPGRGGYHAYMGVLRHAFPDLDIVVASQSVTGDAITTGYRARGTFAGAYGRTAPSGERVEIAGVLVSRFDGHLIAEEWNDYDRTAMRRQMV